MLKKILLFFVSNITFFIVFSQTNTFPSTGNVGIGTTSPADLLVVNSGNLSFTTPGNFGLKWAAGSRLYEQTTTTGSENRMICQPYSDNFEILNAAGSAYIASFHGFSSALANRIIFYNGLIIGDGTYPSITPPLLGAIIKGNVGIGTSSPNAKLDVNGKVFIGASDANTPTQIAPYSLAVDGSAIFTKAVVKLKTSWPDYVFKPGYHLPKLDSLETFLKTNRHLPGIPTSKEVAKNGIDLGNNQAELLKKVEELTLIVIEENKKVEDQQKLLELQNERIRKLECKLKIK